MKKILILVTILSLSLFGINFASATHDDACSKMEGGVGNQSSLCKNQGEAKTFIPRVVGALAWGVGVLAVIMIIWAGIQYTISAGDSGKIGKAKNTLIAAVIGLVIALMAGAITTYIINNINKK